MRIALLFFLLSLAIQAGETNTAPENVEIIGRSPLQTFYIEQHRLATNETMQVWIVPSKRPNERRLLYTHSRSIEVHWAS